MGVFTSAAAKHGRLHVLTIFVVGPTSRVYTYEIEHFGASGGLRDASHSQNYEAGGTVCWP